MSACVPFTNLYTYGSNVAVQPFTDVAIDTAPSATDSSGWSVSTKYAAIAGQIMSIASYVEL